MESLFGGVSILAAILGIGFVIFIHELGHFLAAKWAGVRVDRFSIGMGPVIWSKQWGETEYALSLLPVGGYVKMLGQEEMPGTVADTTDPRSFAAKSVGWRVVILAAGVVFNLVSSYLILLALAWYGMPVIPSVVGQVEETVIDQDGVPQTSPAEILGVTPGDIVLAVGDQPVRSFEDIPPLIIGGGMKPVTLTVERRGEVIELAGPDGAGVLPVYSRSLGIPAIGLGPAQSNKIGAALTYGAALPEELQSGARVIAVAGVDTSVATGQQVITEFLKHGAEEVALRVESSDGTVNDVNVRVNVFGIARGFGLPVVVGAVMPKQPAALAGMQPGDIIYQANGQRVFGASQFTHIIQQAHTVGKPLAIDVIRAGVLTSLTMQPQMNERMGRPLIGIQYYDGQAGPLPQQVIGDSILAEAGVAAGSVVIDWEAEPLDPEADPASHNHVLHYIVREEAELQLLELTKEQRQILDTTQTVSRISQVFGASAPLSVWARLAGSEVVALMIPRFCI